jgi:beta-lactamase regulating signal transducer with metallopeptidase domain
MNALLQWYPGDCIVGLALNVVAQVTLVAAAAGLLAVRLRRHPARCHGIALAAMVFILLSPGVVWVTRDSGLSLLTIPLASEAASQPTERAVHRDAVAPLPARMEIGRTTEHREDRHNAAGDFLRAAATVIAAGWAIGLVGRAIGLIHAQFVIYRWRRLARLVDHGDLADILEEVRSGLGMKRLPRIGVCRGVAGPVAVGLLRPAVLLPEHVAAMSDRRGLRSVVLHECAHVARRDAVVVLVQRVAAMLFWPHPLVHWLNRRLTQAREDVCDNYVLRQEPPAAYGRVLLELGQRLGAAWPATAAMGMFRTPWSLEHRVAGLLDPGRSTMTTASRAGVVVCLTVFCAFGAAVAAVRAVPQQAASPPTTATTSPASPIQPALRPFTATWKLDQHGRLCELSLAGSKITNDGLAGLRGLTDLAALSLENTAIGDDGLKHLAGLKNLRFLDVSGTRVTNDGLYHLQGLSRLETLVVAGSQIDDDGIAAFGGLPPEAYDNLNQFPGGMGGMGGGGLF